MNRLNQVLLIAVIALACFGGYRWLQQNGITQAPVPGFSVVDPVTAADLTRIAEECKTAKQWHELANVYMSAGYFAEADACYRQATKMDPEFGDAIYDHAFCLSRFGKTEPANEKFEQVISLKHPKSANAYFFMGRNHLRDENPDQAAAAFRKASKLPMAKFELARLLFRKSEFDEAEELLADVLEKQPTASRAKLLLSNIAAAKENQPRATSFSSEGSDRTDRIPTPFVDEKIRLGKATQSYGVDQQTADLFKLMGESRFDEAKPGLEKLQSIQWTTQVQDALIRVATAKRDFKEAERLIEEEVARSGPTTIWLGTLGNTREELGDIEGAVEAWKQGAEVRNDKTLPKCLSKLGQYYEKKGNLEKANEYQVLLFLELARQAITQDQIDQALEYAQRAEKVAPTLAKVQYMLGKVYRKRAENEKSAAAYRKCLELDPTFGRAIVELQLVE
jgi:tetratricopeptide (TPR) repeat protein